jgi:hypothetical protein
MIKPVFVHLAAHRERKFMTDRADPYLQSYQCDHKTDVIRVWYLGLDKDTRAQVDTAINKMIRNVPKLGEQGGLELIGKLMLWLMKTGRV